MRKSRWFVLIAGVIALDQVTKAFFFDAECVLLPGALHLRGVRNTGAAFSMLSANPFLVALLSFGVIVVSFPVVNIADAVITAGAILAARGVLRIKEV